jgi:GNAT superfamily N-acetyltransferase
MLTQRDLTRSETELIWQIDRSEEIRAVYHCKADQWVLQPEEYHLHGWPAGEPEKYAPLLLESFDRGGWFHAFFDEDKIVAATVLDHRLFGEHQDMLLLIILQVGNGYRGTGLGKALFTLAKAKTREWGGKWMYISATPSEHTIAFYRAQGAILASPPDPQLFEFEPEDMHMICPV